MTFLATTGLTECWDTTSERLVLLGPWCLRYDRKPEWSGLRYELLATPWPDHAAVEHAGHYCTAVVDQLVRDLRLALNAEHGTAFSERYWRIVLGPWLTFYVHALYDRFTCLKNASQQYANLRTFALPASEWRRPSDWTDLIRLLRDDAFNLQLYGQVIESSPSLGIALLPAPSMAPAVAEQQPGTGAGSRLCNRLSLAAARALHPGTILGEIHLAPGEAARLLAALAREGGAVPLRHHGGQLPLSCHVQDFADRPVNAALRARLGSLPARDAFHGVALRTLAHNLPVLYLEAFADFRDLCVKAAPSDTDVFCSDVDWYTNEFFKLLAAEGVERGARLVGFQHGGFYGTAKVAPAEVFERSITDVWLTYGWSDARGVGAAVEPACHPRFSRRLRPRPDRGITHRLGLITAGQSRYVECFYSQPQGEPCLQWRTRFVRALGEAARAALVVRTLPELDSGWSERARLVDDCGRVHFDDNALSLRAFARTSRIAVVEYAGTALLETMFDDVPTTLFLDPQWWRVRAEQQALFDQLRRVGILWDTPEECAAHVSRVWAEPRAWWDLPAVQEVRREFLSHHVRSPQDWYRQWSKVIGEQIQLSRLARQQRATAIPFDTAGSDKARSASNVN